MAPATGPGQPPATQLPAAQPPATQLPAAQPPATAPAVALPNPGVATPGLPPLAGLPLPGVPVTGRPGRLPAGRPGSATAPSDPDLPHHLPGGVDGDAVLRDLQRTLARCLAMAAARDDLAGRLRDSLAQVQPQLLVPLSGPAEHQRDQLRAALAWLVDNLDRPSVVAAGCGQLGGVLREWGITPQQAQLVGAALAEAMRSTLGAAWRRDMDAAWRTTWRLAHRWLSDGAAAAAYTPVTWSALVVGHQRRRDDLAVVWVRPYLPFPFVAGQYTRLEVAQAPGLWRPYSLASTPRLDNVLELHVRAKGPSGVSGALVYDTVVGDRVRLRTAAGATVLDPDARRDLLLIGGDTGVAPLKALLGELAVTGDPRAAVLFWGARSVDELYDIAELEALAAACRRATVVPVISEGDPGPYPSGLVTDAVAAYGRWSEHEVFLAGPPAMVAETRTLLRGLGVDAARIHHDPPQL
jgi:NAD(P)H-flavin reductase